MDSSDNELEQAMNIVRLQDCEYNKKNKTLKVASEVFGGMYPREFYIQSHHSGIKVKFVHDDVAAVQHEFWDGEMAEYIPESPMKNVVKVIVHHAW